MYFGTKNYLKNNHYYTTKHLLKIMQITIKTPGAKTLKITKNCSLKKKLKNPNS